MLRTNHIFLSYLEALYIQQGPKDDIVLKTFSKGEKILIQGQTLPKVMLIKEGIAKCYFSEENGKEYIVEFLGSGEILGEVEVIKNTTCLCSVEAVSEVAVYAVSLPYFKSLIQNDLRLNHVLMFLQNVLSTLPAELPISSCIR
ncbi:Crp/Fnr family transcriptional regulator [Chryseobacterium sp.]|uniref:Crp/Fnr family transcriptional regulator n=1 Tax=Chryseobacterium sp. TaxID=1871047 RepID=UPI00345B7624